jgi:hypothetical protein
MSQRIGRVSRSRKYRIRRRPASVLSPTVPSDSQEFAARIRSDLAVDLPEEDLAEDLSETLEAYELGSKPRCEEAEYLELMADAIERIARGR